jgi:hypothetical protein
MLFLMLLYVHIHSTKKRGDLDGFCLNAISLQTEFCSTHTKIDSLILTVDFSVQFSFLHVRDDLEVIN